MLRFRFPPYTTASFRFFYGIYLNVSSLYFWNFRHTYLFVDTIDTVDICYLFILCGPLSRSVRTERWGRWLKPKSSNPEEDVVRPSQEAYLRVLPSISKLRERT
jgi:hypothetical protein